MRQKYWTRLSRIFLVFAVVATVSCIPSIASATCSGDQQSCSTNYGVGQAVFNSGGADQCPLLTGSQYCANVSAGDLADGGTSGNQYQAKAGSVNTVDRQPFLSFSVGGAATDLGYLPLNNTATVNANFTVQTYLAGGYIVQVSAPPPTDDVPSYHKLATPTTPTAPSAGTEMFGMNLIANSTNPGGGSTPYGANPQCSPDSSFCPAGALTSSVTSNYNQNGKYYYPGSGTNYTDTIISSNTSTGDVSYTLSFVYDISASTPDGLYTYNGMFIATSTY